MKFIAQRNEVRACLQYVIEIDDWDMANLLRPAELEALQRMAQSHPDISPKVLYLAKLVNMIETRAKEMNDDERKKNLGSGGEPSDGSPHHPADRRPILGQLLSGGARRHPGSS